MSLGADHSDFSNIHTLALYSYVQREVDYLVEYCRRFIAASSRVESFIVCSPSSFIVHSYCVLYFQEAVSPDDSPMSATFMRGQAALEFCVNLIQSSRDALARCKDIRSSELFSHSLCHKWRAFLHSFLQCCLGSWNLPCQCQVPWWLHENHGWRVEYSGF